MSKAKDEHLLREAMRFDRVMKDVVDSRTRNRRDLVKMHDEAKRSMDDAAKRLGK